jgi:hypothetical protein
MSNYSKLDVNVKINFDSWDGDLPDYRRDPSLRAPVILECGIHDISLDQFVEDLPKIKRVMIEAGAEPDTIILAGANGYAYFLGHGVETEEMTKKRFEDKKNRDLKEEIDRLEYLKKQVKESEKKIEGMERKEKVELP